MIRESFDVGYDLVKVDQSGELGQFLSLGIVGASSRCAAYDVVGPAASRSPNDVVFLGLQFGQDDTFPVAAVVFQNDSSVSLLHKQGSRLPLADVLLTPKGPLPNMVDLSGRALFLVSTDNNTSLVESYPPAYDVAFDQVNVGPFPNTVSTQAMLFSPSNAFLLFCDGGELRKLLRSGSMQSYRPGMLCWNQEGLSTPYGNNYILAIDSAGRAYVLYDDGGEGTIPLPTSADFYAGSELIRGSSTNIYVTMKQKITSAGILYGLTTDIATPTSIPISFSSQDDFKHLSSYQGTVYFHHYQKSTGSVILWSVNENESLPTQLSSIPCPPGTAVQVGFSLINDILAVRYSFGPVVLARGNLSAVLASFEPAPQFSPVDNMIFATQGAVGRLYFNYYDANFRDTLYISRSVPCLTEVDCTNLLGAWAVCSSDKFCSLLGSPTHSPPASTPVAAPSTPPTAPTFAPPPTAVVLVCAPPPPAIATCVSGVWVVNSSIVVPPGGNISIPSPTTINGNFSLSNTSTVVIKVEGTGAITSIVVVSGCVVFGGTLTVDAPNQATIVNSTTIDLVQFEGYCGGLVTQFSNATINLGCATLKAPPEELLRYNQRSLSLVLDPSAIDSSGCSRDTVSGIVLSSGAIAGIVVGAVALVVIVAVVIIWVARKRLIPHYRVSQELKARNLSEKTL